MDVRFLQPFNPQKKRDIIGSSGDWHTKKEQSRCLSLEHQNRGSIPGAVAVAVVGDRRIEVVSGDLTLPAVNLDPILSSAGVGWKGLLLEEHNAGTPHAVEAPEHFSTKHLLRLNTGVPSTNDWCVDGQHRRTRDQAGAVSILPAGVHVSVVAASRTSCLVLEMDPSILRQSSQPHRGADIELPVKLTTPDRHIELLMMAMQADLDAGSSTGPIYGESLGSALSTYLVTRYGAFVPRLEVYKGGLPKSRLNHIREYIEQHLDGNISLTALAEAADLSEVKPALRTKAWAAFPKLTGSVPERSNQQMPVIPVITKMSIEHQPMPGARQQVRITNRGVAGNLPLDSAIQNENRNASTSQRPRELQQIGVCLIAMNR